MIQRTSLPTAVATWFSCIPQIILNHHHFWMLWTSPLIWPFGIIQSGECSNRCHLSEWSQTNDSNARSSSWHSKYSRPRSCITSPLRKHSDRRVHADIDSSQSGTSQQYHLLSYSPSGGKNQGHDSPSDHSSGSLSELDEALAQWFPTYGPISGYFG